MILEKKLGIWGKDEIIAEDKKIHAEDYCCVKCYEGKKENSAEVFWPAIDPDIQGFPYCRKCVDYLKMKFILEMEDFGK